MVNFEMVTKFHNTQKERNSFKFQIISAYKRPSHRWNSAKSIHFVRIHIVFFAFFSVHSFVWLVLFCSNPNFGFPPQLICVECLNSKYHTCGMKHCNTNDYISNNYYYYYPAVDVLIWYATNNQSIAKITVNQASKIDRISNEKGKGKLWTNYFSTSNSPQNVTTTKKRIEYPILPLHFNVCN